MDVAELLDSLLFRPDIEIIEASLPKSVPVIWSIPTGGAPGLADFARPGNSGPFQTASETELQRLNGSGESSSLWFSHQQMNVFGHNHVSKNGESVSAADSFENLQKQITSD